jgi:hypothetical protein
MGLRRRRTILEQDRLRVDRLKTCVRGIGVALGVIRQPDLVARSISEHPAPDDMKSGIVYIVRGAGYQKWALFRCPGHEDEIIQLSLMSDRRPRWAVTTDIVGRPTISPSVRQLDKPFAHFWVKRGKVEWCADSGRPAGHLFNETTLCARRR